MRASSVGADDGTLSELGADGSGVAMTAALGPSCSNQAGNGIVGRSFSGLPPIARCPQILAQDCVRGGMTYAANDGFCLHGQRHIAISGAFAREGILVSWGG